MREIRFQDPNLPEGVTQADIDRQWESRGHWFWNESEKKWEEQL
jgi:hypothetical protein